MTLDPPPRKTDRKAVGLLVKLKHEDVGTFVEEFATNLSTGGMFIRSRQPPPVGTPVKFEVQIAGGMRVMRGSALVRWIRQPGDPSGPPGMGLQFEQVDEPTGKLIEKMLAHRPPEAEAPSPVQDEVSELEQSLRAQYGEPPPAPMGMAKVSPLSRPTAAVPARLKPAAPSLVEPVAPMIAPQVLAVAPPPAVPAPPSPEEDFSFAFPAETAFSGEPAVAVAPEASLPLEWDVPEAEAALPLVDSAPPPALDPEKAIDIGFDELIAATPPPLEEPAEEPASVLDTEALDLTFPAPELASEPLEDLLADPLPPIVSGRKTEPAAPVPVPTLQPQAALPATAPQSKGALRTVYLTPPENVAGVGPIIGIDLGTSNSCVAVLSKGRPSVLRSKDGYNTIPSVVALTKNNKLLVSHRAKGQLMLNPSQTIYGAKRLVGRPYESATVKDVRERFHYQICSDERGMAAVQLGDQVLSLEEIQGIVLRECKEMAEQHLQQPVERAVITVPAYYSEPQREAVRRAGAMAGLKVERILNEPTAAALAYGLNRELTKTVLVYDLGGGTFDATVLKIEKNVFGVLATGGDTFLGGADFDNLVVDFLLERFQQTEKIAFNGDSVALSRVLDAAERAKVELSERTSVEVHVPMLMMDAAGKPRELRCTLTRSELEKVSDGLVKRTLDVVRDVLLDAKLQAKEIEEVILVGGQSRMPKVREHLRALFGRHPHASVNADEAVAIGAALFSGSVDKVSSVVLIDVLPMTIGIGMPGGAFKRVLERNSPLPVQKSFAVSTSQDDEKSLEFSVFQGEDSHIAANDYLGTVRVEDLPRGPKGTVKVAVTLKLDSECVLHVEAREFSTHREITATLATRYSPEQLQQQLKITNRSASDAEARRSQDLRERAGQFWGFLRKVIGRG